MPQLEAIELRDEPFESEEEIVESEEEIIEAEEDPVVYANEAAISAYMKGSGVSREQVDEALDRIREISEVAQRGVFDASCVEFIIHGLSYENDVDRARQQGVIEGRNQQIAEAFRDLRTPQGVDIPSFGGMAGIGTGKRGASIFDMAKGAR